ncbi:MAG: sporulation protein [Peptococcaceae bacterium BICA1-7]|nr:MAG: sporulation protein [Peptococcaceae bacterium BICA1-7]HBV97327.1 sporulation protein YunB [Desulfotomaculum sp.]
MFKRRRPFKKAFLFVVTVVFLVALWSLDMQIRKTLYEMAEVRAVQLATEAVYNAVLQKVAGEGMLYEDLIIVHKDSAGNIVLMQADTAKINKIASDTTLAVQSAILRLGEESLYIPLGQITGSYYLASRGPKIRVDIVPIGTVRVNVDDRFEQSGINQTRHSIYLVFNTDIRVVVPLKSGQASVATQVPVAESIIVGDVPSTFVTLSDGFIEKSINR